MTQLMRLSKDQLHDLIRERKRLGHDRYDEVWEGMYVMPSLPTNAHQRLVQQLGRVFDLVVAAQGLGEVYPGANVSDRRKGWKFNHRCPDVLVVLNGSRAIDCGTHFFGGPDFVVEIESPGDDTEEKVPFYGKVGVRELLILHRDRRTIRLLRLEGEELIETKPVLFEGHQWFVSEVLPLAFRRKNKGAVRTEVRRTDGPPDRWTI
jgi:Uma2 family endonuclease